MSDPAGGGGWAPPPNRIGPGWGQPAGPSPGVAPQAAPTGPKTDPLAIASLALGAFSLLSCACLSFIVVPFALVAAILGFVSLSNVRNRPELYRGRELAIAGIVLSVLTIVLIVIAFFLPFGFLGLAALLGQHAPPHR